MEKLFVYGSLRPGRENESVLKKIGGNWEKGFVWGELYDEGWGASLGCPGIRLEEKVKKIYGYVFYSKHLNEHWQQLDDFEGIVGVGKKANQTWVHDDCVVAHCTMIEIFRNWIH